MSNVVEFKRKSPTQAKQKMKAPTRGMSESYYFTISGTKFNFGGAFVRDVLAKIELHRDAIETSIHNLYDSQISSLALVTELDESLKEVFTEVFKESKTLTTETLLVLKTPEDFDMCMSENSEYLEIMPILLACAVSKAYTAFDIRRMERDNWILVETPADKLITTLNATFL